MAAKTPSAVTAHTITGPTWPTLYGIRPRGAVLVRADGHIGWRTADLPDAGTGRCAHPTQHLLHLPSDRVVAHILVPPGRAD